MKLAKGLRRLAIRKLRAFLGEHVIGLLTSGFICSSALFLIEFCFALAMQWLLIAMGMPGRESMPSFFSRAPEGIGPALIFLGAVVTVRAGLQWLQTTVQNSVSTSFTDALRMRVLRWGFASPTLKLTTFLPLYGDVSTSAGSALFHLQQLVFYSLVTALLACALLWILPLPTLAAFATFAICVWPVIWVSRTIQTSGLALNLEASEVSRRLQRSYKILLFLKIYAKDEQERTEIELAHAGILRRFLRFFRISGAVGILPQLSGVLILCGLIYFANATMEERTRPLLIPYLYLFFRFAQSAALISQNFAQLSFFWPSFEKMARWWNQHAHDRPGAAEGGTTRKEIPGAESDLLGWRLHEVRFRYEDGVQDAIQPASLCIRPGSCAAFVGPSGGGKSTLVSLLLDQLEPTAGVVEIESAEGLTLPLREHRDSFLKRIGYVGPEPFLFEGTVRENLLFGLDAPPDEARLRGALESAKCHFVWDSPKGLDHFLTDQGAGLSAGQKQRLSLARAFLRNPSVLVLDEATSNLDSATESGLIEILRKLKGQMTMLIVTHRASLLTLADDIFEIQNGVISNKGPQAAFSEPAGALQH